jgi:hypothetical protein
MNKGEMKREKIYKKKKKEETRLMAGNRRERAACKVARLWGLIKKCKR